MAEIACYFILMVTFAALIWGARLGVRDLGGGQHLVSAHSAMLMLFFFYVVFSSSLSILFDDFQFTWAPALSGAEKILPIQLIGLFAIVSYLICYRLVNRYSSQRPHNIFALPTQSNKLVGLIATSLISVGMVLKIYVFLKSGGLTESITRASGGLAEVYGMSGLDTSVTTAQNFSGVAEIGACWMLIDAMQKRRLVLPWSIVVLGVMGLSYLSLAKRTLLIEPIGSVVIAYSFYVRKLKINLLPYAVPAVVIFGGGSLFFRAVLPAQINSVTIDFSEVFWAHGSAIGFYLYSLEYATFEAMSVAIHEADAVFAVFGGALAAFYKTNIEPFLYVIPRDLWREKPINFLDLSQGISSLIFGIPLSVNTAGVAPTYIGSSWAFGGVFGTLGYSAMLGIFAARSDVLLMKSGSANKTAVIAVYSILLFFVFTLMRQGSLAYTFMITFPNQVGYLLGLGILLMGSYSGGLQTQKKSMLVRSTSAKMP